MALTVHRTVIHYHLCSNPLKRRKKKQRHKCASALSWPTRKGVLETLADILTDMRTFSAHQGSRKVELCDKQKQKAPQGCFLLLAYPKGFDSRRELRALVAGGSDSPPDCHSLPPLFESSQTTKEKTEAQMCLCSFLAYPKGFEPSAFRVGV